MSWRVDQWIAAELGENPSPAQLRRLIGLVDAKLAAQIEAILHSPAFQQLEGVWRGLKFLVDQAAGAPVEVHVLDVSADDLRGDLEAAPDVEETGLWRAVENGFALGRPFSLLVFAGGIGPGGDDLLLLQYLALVGGAWQTPVLADADAAILDIEDWTQLSTIRGSILETAAGPTHAAWRSFREKEDAAYAALALPPVRARDPHHAAAFSWDESRARVPWMQAGMVVATALVRNFAAEGLRFHEPAPEDAIVPAPTGGECRLAVEISERRAADFAKLGLTPLWPVPGTLQASVGRWSTCHRPPSYHDAQVQAAADLMTRFDLLLTLTSFARGVMLQARRHRLARASAAGMQPHLQQWLEQYVATPVAPDRPLAHAQVKLGKTEAHRPMPPLQVELQLRGVPPWPALRLALEIP